ncbi:hypothetical protein [Ferrovibrio xuzhouensis]|uniref:Uncharacterized protein n=1 Tax=Ferrovibrio xuzhouensis TaxID=1576914 RepID=A0ABV7VBZ5_9PROT
MSVSVAFRPATIVRVRLKGHVLHGQFAVVDGMIDGMLLDGPHGKVALPRLVSLRAAQGAFAGERFALLPQWLAELPVTPVWAAKLRRQAYGLDIPLTPISSPVPPAVPHAGTAKR